MAGPAIALIGCGAIAEAFYLPALAMRPELMRSVVLVDPDVSRAEAIRTRVGAESVASSHTEVLDRVDAAIIATPHHLHTPVTLECIERNVHVLCEKPISSTGAEVDEISSKAAERRVVVTINQTRRLYTSLREVQRLAVGGAIGEVKRIECSLGGAFGWPAAGNTYFGSAAGGRGVLFDFGAHVVDMVCWFLGGLPELENYADDSYGGTEAVAKVRLRSGDAWADIHLSWLSALPNRYRIVGTEGALGGEVLEGSSYVREFPGGRSKVVRTDKAREFTYYADKLLDNFLAAIEEREPLLITPEDVRPSIAIIDQCYSQRARLPAPWFDACRRLAHA